MSHATAPSASDALKQAHLAYDRNDYAAMIDFSSQLVTAGDPWKVQGYFLRGMAYEHWLDGPEGRLRTAVDNFRTAAILAPHANAYQNLARALMKLGDSHYDEAYRLLLEGWEWEKSPELMLGLGHYFLTKPTPEPDQALEFYKRAALRGRFRGFMTAAAILRRTGKPVQALGWDVARISLAPILWLLQGRRAHFEF